MWYYADGGQQKGPVDESALDDLVRSGVIQSDTLVWREGQANWMPYSVARGSQSGAPPLRRPGGFWMRFLAVCLDGLLVGIVAAIVRFPLTAMMGAEVMGIGFNGGDPSEVFRSLPRLAGLVGLSTLINFALGAAYETYFVSTRGATPGKMALGLKVIRADGQLLSPMHAFGRHCAKLLSYLTLFIGLIIAAFDGQKRALHDYICDTRVVRER